MLKDVGLSCQDSLELLENQDECQFHFRTSGEAKLTWMEDLSSVTESYCMSLLKVPRQLPTQSKQPHLHKFCQLAKSHSLVSRWLCLKEQLNLPKDGLRPEELTQLEELLCAAEDVFALDDTELGYTSLVQHRVDTGDHPLVKQLPRRLLFSRRKLLSSLTR